MKLYRILILTLCAYALISCGGAEERKAVYMEKAKSSIKAGDIDKARIELKNVLQIDPKDGEAYYYLGTVFEKQKNYRKAYVNYLKAEDLNPELLQNQARLGRLYLLMNDSDKAQQKINLILSKEPNNTEGLLLKAMMMLKNEDKSQAIDIVNKLVVKQPGYIDAVLFLVSIHLRDNDYQAAISLIDKALAVKEDNVRLSQILALVLMSNKDYDRAEIIYTKLLETNPDNSTNYNNLSAFYMQRDNQVNAEKTLRASIDNDPDDESRQLTLVKYIREIKGDDEAIVELKKLISNNNNLGELRIAIGELYILSGNKKSAIEVFKQAIKDFPGEVTNVDASISLANLYLSERNVIEASEVIEDVIKISPNDPEINLLMAKVALSNKDVEKAIISLRITTKETPENIEAFLLLSKAYKLKGNEEQAKSALDSAYDNNRMNADALMKLAKIQLGLDIDLAETIIDDYNNIKESDYDGLVLKVIILNKKQSYEEALKIADLLIELYPDRAVGYQMSIPYYRQLGDEKKVVSILEKGYINAKDNRVLLVLLTSLQVSEKKFDVVEKRINAELVSSPDDAELKVLLSKVYMASNNIDSAIALLNEVIDKNKPDMEEPYLILSQIYKSKNDLSSVKSILVKGNSNVASSTKIPLKLATVYELDGDYQNAIVVYRELHESYPENIIVINNLASMLSDHSTDKNDLELMLSLAEKLQKSEQPLFLDTVGWVYYKSGNYQTALQHLSQVVDKFPDVNVFNYHIGMAYKMAGDKDQAKVYLEKSLSDSKPFAEKASAEDALKDL